MTWLHLNIVRHSSSTGYFTSPTVVNSDHIVYMRPITDQLYSPAQTYIQTVNIMPDDCWFDVKESLHEILSQIPCP